MFTVTLTWIRNAREITFMLLGISQVIGTKLRKKIILFCIYPLCVF